MREPWWSRRLTHVLLIKICCGRASLLLPPSAPAQCGEAALRPSCPPRPGPAPQGVAALELDFDAGARSGRQMVSQYSLRLSRASHSFRLSRSACVVPERRVWRAKATQSRRLCRRQARGSEAVGQAPGGFSTATMEVLSRPEPSGAPRGTGAEFGHWQRRYSTVCRANSRSKSSSA